MIDRKMVFGLFVFLAVSALVLAYSIEQYWFGAAVSLGLGLVGVLGWYRKPENVGDWTIDLFLVGIVLLVLFGAFLNLILALLIAAVVSGLGAWDLLRFQKSLVRYSSSEHTHQIERRHLILLGITLVVGGIMAVGVSFVRIQIGFFPSLVIGVVLILTLSVTIQLLRK